MDKNISDTHFSFVFIFIMSIVSSFIILLSPYLKFSSYAYLVLRLDCWNKWQMSR